MTEPNISTAASGSPQPPTESGGADAGGLTPEQAWAEIGRLRSQLDFFTRVLADTARSYNEGLSSSSVDETLVSLTATFHRYLNGMTLAPAGGIAFCRIGENGLGLQIGSGAGDPPDALVDACFKALDDASAPLAYLTHEGKPFVVAPICRPEDRRGLLGLVAAEIDEDRPLPEDTAAIIEVLPVATAFHLERLAQLGLAGRSAQFARAAARSQVRLTEPHDRDDALRVANDELSKCEDLIGTAAVELAGDVPRVVARYGTLDDERAMEVASSANGSGYTELPVLIDGQREALLIAESVSGELSDDEMLRSIPAAIAGTVVRYRAAGTIESLRRSATRRLVEAQERERSMVAADIHDGVLQQLGATAIRLELAQLRVEQSDFETARAIIEDGAKEIRSCARELRALLMELRPQVLDDNGLNAALKELGRHVEEVEVEVTSNVPDDLGNEYSITVFRIVQEALTNIQKHARASEASVDVGIHDERVVIEIKDNGVGYEGAVSGPSAEGSHLGLLGMRERARMLGGEFSIAGASGGGTVVRALLPLNLAGSNNGRTVTNSDNG